MISKNLFPLPLIWDSEVIFVHTFNIKYNEIWDRASCAVISIPLWQNINCNLSKDKVNYNFHDNYLFDQLHDDSFIYPLIEINIKDIIRERARCVLISFGFQAQVNLVLLERATIGRC